MKNKPKENPIELEDEELEGGIPSSKVRKETSERAVSALSAPTGKKFTEDELRIIEQEKSEIDFSDTGKIIVYGSDVAGGISEMTEKILSDHKLGSLKAIGGELSDLIVSINTGDTSEKGGGLMKWVKTKIWKTKVNRMDAGEAIEKLEGVIQEAGEKVDSYIPELDELRDNNMELIKRLGLLVAAGKQRIEEEKAERERLEKEYMENDGRIDELEQSDLNMRDSNIKQFIQRINDLERVALVAITNISQISLIRDAAVNTKTKMLQLQETAIPAIRIQTAVSTMANEVSNINQMGKEISDKVQTILVESAKMTKDLAVSSATEAQRPVIEDKTFKQVVTTLIQTQEDVKRICEEGERKLLLGNENLKTQLAELGTGTTPKQLEHK